MRNNVGSTPTRPTIVCEENRKAAATITILCGTQTLQASQRNGSAHAVNERFDFARPTGSTPAGAGATPARLASPLRYAVVAQMVEFLPSKQGVASSSLVSRSNMGH